MPEGTLLAGRIRLGAVLAQEAQAQGTAALGYVLALAAQGLQRGEDHLALTVSARRDGLRLRLELGAQTLRAAGLAGRVWWQSRRAP